MDLHRIWLFLPEQNVSYADKVEARLQHRASTLAQLPFSGRLVSGTALRRLSVPDVQYVIEYKVTDDRVFIARVRSTRENWERP